MHRPRLWQVYAGLCLFPAPKRSTFSVALPAGAWVLTPVTHVFTGCMWCRQKTAESIRDLEQEIEDVCEHLTQLQETVAHVQRHRALSTEIPALEQQQSAEQKLEQSLVSKVSCCIVKNTTIILPHRLAHCGASTAQGAPSRSRAAFHGASRCMQKEKRPCSLDAYAVHASVLAVPHITRRWRACLPLLSCCVTKRGEVTAVQTTGAIALYAIARPQNSPHLQAQMSSTVG